MKKVNIGGDRIGSGNKMNVELHNYERSNHNRGYIYRTTGSMGTCRIFMKMVCTPGTTLDIDLDAVILTNPTIGPVFGSAKWEGHIFVNPIRLYQGRLHNNESYIGRNMQDVKLPLMTLIAKQFTTTSDIDNAQINPSCLLSYAGIRGVGIPLEDSTRDFPALVLLMYWEIIKNYYCNQQEEVGAVIHNTFDGETEPIDSVEANGTILDGTTTVLLTAGSQLEIAYPGVAPTLSGIMIRLTDDTLISAEEIGTQISDVGGVITIAFDAVRFGSMTVNNWEYRQPNEAIDLAPQVAFFPLANIDTMRKRILAHAVNTSAFNVNTQNLTPYSWVLGTQGNFPNMLLNQEGLAVKTYNSDKFNNYMNTEWIDGPGGVSEVTAIDTSDGSFTVDAMVIAKAVWNMLNRVNISGGSYRDWEETVYMHAAYRGVETPMYVGGIMKNITFQEVVSNTASETSSGTQPLGTLAGRGVTHGHKGGRVVVKIDELSYVIGIESITPRIDYSQGNHWDMGLFTMDDFHKPALDQIGFQDLPMEELAWWSTTGDTGVWTKKFVGKTVAWIDYMTEVNRCYGNFAIQNNQMFMTFNRRYEYDSVTKSILDNTTYIDPVKFNQIFAETALDAQNFWIQVSVDIFARQKMSQRVMPNL